IAVDYGGELVGSDLASCLAEATRAMLKTFQPPGCVYGWRGEFRLQFPHPKIEIPADDDG
ncbi:MAG TPA: hypothetical protein VMK12_06440, partial [Anaeromyxobacteraceae bacterium]|nr:hypothetical protein [Anaeromyxobacteraceae bacterium]